MNKFLPVLQPFPELDDVVATDPGIGFVLVITPFEDLVRQVLLLGDVCDAPPGELLEHPVVDVGPVEGDERVLGRLHHAEHYMVVDPGGGMPDELGDPRQRLHDRYQNTIFLGIFEHSYKIRSSFGFSENFL